MLYRLPIAVATALLFGSAFAGCGLIGGIVGIIEWNSIARQRGFGAARRIASLVLVTALMLLVSTIVNVSLGYLRSLGAVAATLLWAISVFWFFVRRKIRRHSYDVKNERNIVLFRPFKAEMAERLRLHVEPVLESYGFVRGIADPSFLSNTTAPLPFARDGFDGPMATDADAFMYYTSWDWEARAIELIRTAQVIVIDVSLMSKGVGIELRLCLNPEVNAANARVLLIAHDSNHWSDPNRAKQRIEDMIGAQTPAELRLLLYGDGRAARYRFHRDFYQWIRVACGPALADWRGVHDL